jgi:hypothetical protein
MGFLKDMKTGVLGDEARKAFEAGLPVFTPRLNMPASQHGMSGNIADWAGMIAAVEDAGWALEHWAVGVDSKGRGEAFPLFRRAASV